MLTPAQVEHLVPRSLMVTSRVTTLLPEPLQQPLVALSGDSVTPPSSRLQRDDSLAEVFTRK